MQYSICCNHLKSISQRKIAEIAFSHASWIQFFSVLICNLIFFNFFMDVFLVLNSLSYNSQLLISGFKQMQWKINYDLNWLLLIRRRSVHYETSARLKSRIFFHYRIREFPKYSACIFQIFTRLNGFSHED